MAATVGYLYNDLQLNFPGTLSPSVGLKFADVPTGLAATHGFPNSVPIAGWVQIIGFIGVLETTTFKQDPPRRRATSAAPSSAATLTPPSARRNSSRSSRT